MARSLPEVISLSSGDGRTVVEFYWLSDRFAHRVLWNRDVVARSVDDDHGTWPASPPIQQLSLETIQHQPTVLGVGASGRSHWSFSAQFQPAREDAQAVRFDVAARLPATDTRRVENMVLRSTYLLSASIDAVPVDGDLWNEDSTDLDCRCLSLRPSVVGPSVVGPSVVGPLAVGTDSSAARVGKTTPTTVRWSYLLQLKK